MNTVKLMMLSCDIMDILEVTGPHFNLRTTNLINYWSEELIIIQRTLTELLKSLFFPKVVGGVDVLVVFSKAMTYEKAGFVS